jgi:chemotaxis protein MotA
MDNTTIGGIIGVWALVALAIVLGGAGFVAYIDIPSVVIVFGGTIAVTIGQFEGDDLKNLTKSAGVAFKEVKVESITELVEKIIFYAIQIKKNDAMSMEQKIMDEPNPFFKEAFALLVDNTKPDVLESLMDTKLEHMEIRHKVQISMFGNMGGTAGAMGMVGTLVGLVAMLANLSDPSSVGPAMAVALLTTMYGALIGTAIAGVLESKLEQKHNVEMIAHQITVKGAIMISSGESVGNIKMKLLAILPQKVA